MSAGLVGFRHGGYPAGRGIDERERFVSMKQFSNNERGVYALQCRSSIQGKYLVKRLMISFLFSCFSITATGRVMCWTAVVMKSPASLLVWWVNSSPDYCIEILAKRL